MATPEPSLTGDGLTPEEAAAVTLVAERMGALGEAMDQAAALGLSTLQIMSLIAQSQGEELPPALAMML